MKMIRTLPTQLHISGSDELNLHNLRFIEKGHGFFTKPKYTFWTSTYRKGKNSKYMSDWHRFLSSEAPELMTGRTPYYYLIDVKEKIRILTVDGYYDTVEFTEKYTNLKPEESLSMEVYRRLISMKTNWDLVAESYDAVHYSGRGGQRQIGGVFHGWDVESTVWFRNKFIRIRSIK